MANRIVAAAPMNLVHNVADMVAKLNAAFTTVDEEMLNNNERGNILWLAVACQRRDVTSFAAFRIAICLTSTLRKAMTNRCKSFFLSRGPRGNTILITPMRRSTASFVGSTEAVTRVPGQLWGSIGVTTEECCGIGFEVLTVSLVAACVLGQEKPKQASQSNPPSPKPAEQTQGPETMRPAKESSPASLGTLVNEFPPYNVHLAAPFPFVGAFFPLNGFDPYVGGAGFNTLGDFFQPQFPLPQSDSAGQVVAGASTLRQPGAGSDSPGAGSDSPGAGTDLPATESSPLQQGPLPTQPSPSTLPAASSSTPRVIPQLLSSISRLSGSAASSSASASETSASSRDSPSSQRGPSGGPAQEPTQVAAGLQVPAFNLGRFQQFGGFDGQHLAGNIGIIEPVQGFPEAVGRIGFDFLAGHHGFGFPWQFESTYDKSRNRFLSKITADSSLINACPDNSSLLRNDVDCVLVDKEMDFDFVSQRHGYFAVSFCNTLGSTIDCAVSQLLIGCRPSFIAEQAEQAEEYTTCIQGDRKQGFQKCSFCIEQPITILSYTEENILNKPLVDLAGSERKLNTIAAYTRQKAKSKYRNLIRLEQESQKQSSDAHNTPYDRVKRCREPVAAEKGGTRETLMTKWLLLSCGAKQPRLDAGMSLQLGNQFVLLSHGSFQVFVVPIIVCTDAQENIHVAYYIAEICNIQSEAILGFYATRVETDASDWLF
ncbi:hypothetical protein PR048_007702 [Dryococelus australis]|uniref:Uncharacterized protein n=1 Tax=Dryococelus australis TaxID=614101 RepID=A0ABQ9HV66_9NEOP|nr:hypothetical protein PR048_007702 [Dryococelus australis]